MRGSASCSSGSGGRGVAIGSTTAGSSRGGTGLLTRLSPRRSARGGGSGCRSPPPPPPPAGPGDEHQTREGGAIRIRRAIGGRRHLHSGQHDQERDDDAVDQGRHRGGDGAGRRVTEAVLEEGAAEDGTARAHRPAPQPPDGAHGFPLGDEHAVDGRNLAGRDQAPDDAMVEAGSLCDLARRIDLGRAARGTRSGLLRLVPGHLRSPYFVASKKLLPSRSARSRTARNPSASRAPAAPPFIR